MYAIIDSGGRQYRVEPGLVVRMDSVEGNTGETVVFDRVKLISKDGVVQVGTPNLAGASVRAEIVAQGREPKQTVIKFKRRKDYHRILGARRHYTKVKVSEIATGA